MGIMDEDNINTEPWRRHLLGDEPIYCAAPPPSNPDDIICFGSDEELDDDAKVAKRLRYEAQGLRYLQGNPVRLMSTVLRGPFDKSSGWENPWLPKQNRTKDSLPKPSQLPAKPLPIIKTRPTKNTEQNDTTQGLGSSLHCHLPSPESNRELQLSDTASETEHHGRIQAWAKEVSRITLEKDRFWAPGQEPHENGKDEESGKKRPAGRTWLKTRLSKRKKLDSSQNATTTSTPMPMPRERTSMRSTSMPTDMRHDKELVSPNKMASQSFELTTPSPSYQNEPGIACNKPVDAPTRHKIIPSQHKPSKTSRSATNKLGVQPTEPKVDDIGGRQREQVSTPGRTSHIEQYSRDGTDQDQQSVRTELDGEFESFLDQSFQYRARPTKQTSPVPGPNTPVIVDHPESTQGGTANSSSHKHTNILTTKPATYTVRAGSQPRQQTSIPGQQACLEPAVVVKASDLPPDTTYKQETGGSIKVNRKHMSTPSAHGEVSKSQPLDDGRLSKRKEAKKETQSSKSQEASDGNTKPTHIYVVGPPIKSQSTNTFPAENKVIETEILPARLQSFVDEDTTLIGDSMDTDRSVPLKANSPSTRAISTTNPGDAMRDLEETAAQGESDTESNPVIVPLSQLEWGISDNTNDASGRLGAVAKDVMKALGIKIQEVPENGSLDQTNLLDSSEIFTRRSVSPDLTIEQINTYETPRITESQQSPWTTQLLGPVKLEQLEHHSTTASGTMTTDTTMVAAGPEEHQSPWGGTSTSLSYPKCPPDLPTPAANGGISLHTHSRSPTSAMKSEQPGSTPTTPPRVSTSPPRTPDLEKSIKTFAMFNTPSPKRRPRQSNGRQSLTSCTRGILSGTTRSNPWNSRRSSRRSSRRVSFAPLPDEGDDASILPASAPSVTRAASPPPQATIDTEDEDVGDHFKNHFDAMKRRTSDEDVLPRLRPRPRPRLLPSESQQKPMSPSVYAMAAAFQEADAHMAHGREDPLDDDKENADQEMTDAEQSPWRKESQGTDDVAAVLNNLGDFLNAWDVEAELAKEGPEPVRESRIWGILG